MYSFSTCWNSQRHTDGRAMLQEIGQLGFQWAELSHAIRISLLPGIIEAVEAGEMRISSLHNYCPLPMGVNHAAPNLFPFSSEDPRERQNALRHSIKTLETAARLKAPVVVLHIGKIQMKDYTSKLVELLERHRGNTERYAELCEEAVLKCEEKKKEAQERAWQIVRQLAEKAEGLGVKLGIENRDGIEDLPLDGDVGGLLREYNHAAVGYWHDTGHAQIKDNLGFINHAFHLESLIDRLIGLHLHDVEYPARDHCAPGGGTVDFAALKPMIKAEHIKVFELSPLVPVEEVKRGIAYVKGLWGEE
jgi:sugar phosphate isomerase/epimerase